MVDLSPIKITQQSYEYVEEHSVGKNTTTKICRWCTWQRWRSPTGGYKPLQQRLLSAFGANDMQDAKQKAHQGQGQDAAAGVEIIGRISAILCSE